jgi:predicted small integral membrane protein
MPLIRLCKTALLGSVAFLLLLVVFNNLTDYNSNYDFVFHVLAMDTTFPGNHGMWRSIHTGWVYHAFYATIILWEATTCALIGAGALRLWKFRGASAAGFNHAKGLAVLGLTLSLIQWFVAFIGVGGEWFLMWQSRTWNGQEAAFRMFTCLGLILLVILQEDKEST